MIFLLYYTLITLLPAYQWQSIPSPNIKTHTHGVIYDPVNDLFFITGGDSSNFEDSDFMDICLEFDPKTDSWETKQPMPTGRGRHRAVYRNGYMHVFCGKDVYGNLLNSHEVYNINSDSWDTAKSSPLLVSRPSVVTWRDSLIYLMGGYDPTHTARNEVYVYYPETDSWDSATFLPRRLHAGTAEIKGDSIFIIGGADGYEYYSEILIGEINPADPTEITWAWGDPLPMAFNVANGFAIKENNAYMIGGSFNDGTNEAWQYEIQNGNWTPLPDYPTIFIHRGDFAQRRDGPDSLGIVYCFMGDTSDYWGHCPTDECYRLAVTENDAGMLAINSPVSDTMIESFVQVNGTVKNYGINTYSFKTYVNIYDPDHLIAFSDSAEVENLAPSDTTSIDFGSLQLTKTGTYTVEMFTCAFDDTYSQNDSLTVTFGSWDCFWESIASSGVKALCHTVVYDPANDLFFIMGGDSTGYQDNMDICLVFDPKNNTWSTKEPMFTAKRGHSATYRNGFIHVLCGSDNYGNKLTYHEVYDISNDSWDLAAPAPLPITYPGAVTWKDSLVYLVGGYDVYHNARTEVYYYNPETNSWIPATSLPRALQGGGVRIKGDSIFIVGGADGYEYYSEILIGEINSADPSEITWSWGDSLPIPYNGRNGFAIKDNKLFMVGGAFDMGINDVWEYDIPSGTWTSLPDYPKNCLLRDNMVERRDGPDSLGIVYCFMGDTSHYSSHTPTDECYRLTTATFSGIKEKEQSEKNSIHLSNTIFTSDDITLKCIITGKCDLKINMYDVVGREVFSKIEKNISTGQHQFNLKGNLKNGIYFIKIEAGSTVKDAKLILIR